MRSVVWTFLLLLRVEWSQFTPREKHTAVKACQVAEGKECSMAKKIFASGDFDELHKNLFQFHENQEILSFPTSHHVQTLKLKRAFDLKKLAIFSQSSSFSRYKRRCMSFKKGITIYFHFLTQVTTTYHWNFKQMALAEQHTTLVKKFYSRAIGFRGQVK